MLKKMFIWLAIIIGAILGLSLIGLFIWHLASPGEAQPILNEDGETIENSISEIEQMELGDLEQYIIIRGHDKTKPVLLFLHGGPGYPEFFDIKRYNPELEKMFVVVDWIQRGTAKSFSSDIRPEQMKIKYMLDDIKELSLYLKQKFNQDKLYLMGHSWGTLLGMKAIDAYPELFHCFFSVGQVAAQYRSEEISMDWIKQKALESGDEDEITAVNAIELPTPDADGKTWINYFMANRRYVTKYGGARKQKVPFSHGYGFSSKEYTLMDKINSVRGILFSLEHLSGELVNSNLFEEIDSVHVPIYFFQGVDDYQTVHQVAKEFYNHVKAPKKVFYEFKDAAHNPIFTQSEAFNEKIKTIISF